MWKGRFPSTMARFCTVELKVRPMFDQIYVPIFEAGDKVISWQGIRANESLSYGGVQCDLLKLMEEVPMCSSQYGLCGIGGQT